MNESVETNLEETIKMHEVRLQQAKNRQELEGVDTKTEQDILIEIIELCRTGLEKLNPSF